MPPGVSVISRNKVFKKIKVLWHHKWVCPPRCVTDRWATSASVHGVGWWTDPFSTHLGGHAHLCCHKSQIFKTPSNGSSHSHQVAYHGTWKKWALQRPHSARVERLHRASEAGRCGALSINADGPAGVLTQKDNLSIYRFIFVIKKLAVDIVPAHC